MAASAIVFCYVKSDIAVLRIKCLGTTKEKLTLRLVIMPTSPFWLMRLLAAVTTDMRRTRLAQRATVLTLRDWTTLKCGSAPFSNSERRGLYFFVDVLQRTIRMLAIANTVSAHARLAGPFLALDQHGC